MEIKKHYRVLTVDDTPALHDDYRKILTDSTGSLSLLRDLEVSLFGDTSRFKRSQTFDLESTFQGEDAVRLVQAALTAGKPFALAFVDMRMPPGWDGLQTIEELWKVDPTLQIVLCTAYSDNTWEEICRRVGNSDNLAILKKPFDSIEVYQLCFAMTRKWGLARQARAQLDDLNRQLAQKTRELELAHEHLQREISLRSGLEKRFLSEHTLDTIGHTARNLASQFLEVVTEIKACGSKIQASDRTAPAPDISLARILDAASQGITVAKCLGARTEGSISQPGPIHLEQTFSAYRSAFDGVLGLPIRWEWNRMDASPEPLVFTTPSALIQLFLGLEALVRIRSAGSDCACLQVTRVRLDAHRGTVHPSVAAGEFVRLALISSAGKERSPENFRSTTPSVPPPLRSGFEPDDESAILSRQVDLCHGWVEEGTAPTEGAMLRVYLPATAETYANWVGTKDSRTPTAHKAA